jgi:hypothetical protein
MLLRHQISEIKSVKSDWELELETMQFGKICSGDSPPELGERSQSGAWPCAPTQDMKTGAWVCGSAL